MDDGSASDKYFELNEFSNAVDFLNRTIGFLTKEGDQFRYKWATISLFHALYGFMLIALGGTTDYARVIDFSRMPKKLKDQLIKIDEPFEKISGGTRWRIEQSNREIWDKYLYSGKAKLIGFEEALKKIQKCEWMEQYTFSKAITLTDNEKKLLKLLFLVRNELLHFKPMQKLYSIEIFSQIIREAVATIRKLCDSGNLSSYDDLSSVKFDVSKLEEWIGNSNL